MQARNGFTLVEILIVVVILGILAAIVIPQFTNAGEAARASSLVSQIQTLRSQLELSQIQHQGVYPDLVTSWNVMTQRTDPDASYDLNNTDGVAGNEVGPYLQQAPGNAFAPAGLARTSVVAWPDTTANPPTTAAWAYNRASGAIVAIVELTQAQFDALGLSANDCFRVQPAP